MKTAKEWIALVKDPVIKRYLECVSPRIVGYEPTYNNFIDFICEYFTWDKSNQGKKFWLKICDFLINNKIGSPSTLSYSDFKHLDKSVETQLNEDKETPKMDIENIINDWYEKEKYSSSHIADRESFKQGYEAALKSVEQPKVSVNEDAVEFAKWCTEKADPVGVDQWILYSDYNSTFTTTELYQNYLEDKHK